ncbi:MAG: hypothetical protein KBT27_11650 [Prevotellaceae bacterium]|nr:hypothetical protein [Candidatus Faecinaster equi]
MILFINRARQYSPNNESNDKAILQAVANNVAIQTDEEIQFIDEEDFILLQPPYHFPQLTHIFTMSRSQEAINILATLNNQGTKIINPPEGLINTERELLLNCMLQVGTPIPKTHIINPDHDICLNNIDYPLWLKKCEGSAQHQDDVIFIENTKQLKNVCNKFIKENINKVLVCEHIKGDIIKFYGVEGTDFFHVSYPTANAINTKFGLELHNGKPNFYTFNIEKLKEHVTKLSHYCHLPIYGGDAIISKKGLFYIIDFNDWPSFSSCKDPAAKAIVKRFFQPST